MVALDSTEEQIMNHSEGKCTEVPLRLQEMFISSEHLNKEEKDLFAQVLVKYENLFSKSSGDLGLTDRVRHRINTGSAQPIKQLHEDSHLVREE